MLCTLCGKEDAKYLAIEKDKPFREVLLGENCWNRTKDCYGNERFWQVHELSKKNLTVREISP